MTAVHAHRFNREQRGNALIAALFMIIVVASLGVFAMRIGSNQQQTANLSLLISRADAAAFSGLEYGARRARNGGQVCGALQAINGFNVIVSGCDTPVVHLVGGVPHNTYVLTSIATSATAGYGNPDYVRRQMTRVVSDIPAAVADRWESGGVPY
jgi:MSHA biogenesis protein MshP